MLTVNETSTLTRMVLEYRTISSYFVELCGPSIASRATQSPQSVRGRAQQRSTTRSQRSERLVSPRARPHSPSWPTTSSKTRPSSPFRSIVAPAPSTASPSRNVGDSLNSSNGLVPLSDPTRHDRSPQFAPFPRRFDREAMVKITTSECSHRPNRTRETRRPEWSHRLAVAVTSEPMSPSAAPRKWLPPPSLRPDR